MRLFRLHRKEDVTGLSGTGIVAEGVLFGDGSAEVRWLTEPYASRVSWPPPNAIEAIQAIHGHDGRTVVEWWHVAYCDIERWTSEAAMATEVE
jgi:hypothetical protein